MKRTNKSTPSEHFQNEVENGRNLRSCLGIDTSIKNDPDSLIYKTQAPPLLLSFNKVKLIIPVYYQ